MSIKANRRAFLAASTAAAGTLAMPSILRAQSKTLTISHFMPPTLGGNRAVTPLTIWTQQIVPGGRHAASVTNVTELRTSEIIMQHCRFSLELLS
jgi:hypothetical protein